MGTAARASSPGGSDRSRGAEALELVRRLRADYAEWARRFYTIRTKAALATRLWLNPVQEAIGRAEREELARRGEARLYVLKARQGGVSTDQQARALHLIWSRRNVDALTLADHRERTDKIFAITLRAVRKFPHGWLPQMGARETREIGFTQRDSHFYTETAGAEGGAGRSLTLWRLHGSEFAHWRDPKATLAATTPALVPRGSVVVLETTGSGFDSEGHQFWRDAREGRNGYRALFFPWWQCDALNYRLPLEHEDEGREILASLSGEEAALVRAHGLDAEQIKWRRAKLAELGRPEFLKEYAEDEETCWLAAGGMFYDPDQLKALLLRAPHPTLVLRGGTLEVFAPLPPGERAIGGADVAEGGGGDRSAAVFRAFQSNRLLSVFADPYATPEQFADFLNEQGRTYPDPDGLPALLVVEKNAHGITVLRRLRDVHSYPPERIYHRTTVGRDREAKRLELGWHTSAETQPLLLDAGRELFTAVAAGGADTVPPAAAVRDAFAVRRDDNGRIKLTGRDVLVAEALVRLGRTYPLRKPSAVPGHSTSYVTI